MKKNLISLIFLLIIGSAIAYYLFEPVIKSPNSYLYSKGGDAVKSYFNFSWYLKYDEGMKHDGINYPYGDHLQYINSHPLYVNILKFIDRHVVELSHSGPGILNLTMILLLILALPFLFLILRKLALPVWYSLIVSLILLWLTPQFDRIHGHFEMVYAVFIPMYWYLLIRLDEGKKRWLRGSLLVLSGLVGGFTSAYFAAFFSIFLLAYLLVKLWVNRKGLKDFKKEGLILFFIAILPIVIVKGLVSLTDWVDDRPDNPWGFFIFHSNIWSIFLPNMSSLKAVLSDPQFLRYEWEGKAYVGWPATFYAVMIVLTLLFTLFGKDNKLKTVLPNKELNVFLTAAFIVLLFSMCVPFKYGFGFLKDLIPPLKQFRALGRFSWIFYYVFTVYTAWIIYFYFRSLKRRGQSALAFALLILSLSYWSIDAGLNIRNSTRGLFNENDLLQSSSDSYQEMLFTAGVNPGEYQALLFLPFANTCGDKLLFHHGMAAFNQAMSLSYHTGIPLIQSFSPRLSFTHALSSIQMLADPPIEKTRLRDMNEKPLLIIQTHEKLREQEQWLADRSVELMRNEQFILYEVRPDVFHNSYLSWRQHATEKKDSLTAVDKSLYSDVGKNLLIYSDFDQSTRPREVFRGESAFYMKEGKERIISMKDFDSLPEGEYDLSFWVYVDTRTDNMPEARLFSWNKNGKPVNTLKLNHREEHNVYNHWLRIDQRFYRYPDQDYALEIKGKYVSLDELLLKPVNADVYSAGEAEFGLFNNYPLL